MVAMEAMEVMAMAGSLERDQQMLKQVLMQMPKQKLRPKLILDFLEGMAIVPMEDIMVAMEAMEVMAMAGSLGRDLLNLKLNLDFLEVMAMAPMEDIMVAMEAMEVMALVGSLERDLLRQPPKLNLDS